MRLLSLDLDRYGPFTGRRLAFRPDARLHVVLGPNEAGKSCALAAVKDLLFGTKATRFEFLHRESGLRLGAEIAARDGRRLAFFRRRGGPKTLTDPAGKLLADDALAPFLGGLTETVFCNAFGLDALSLREGAEEMLKSEGEIGATLFAAASGLRGFRDAARALGEDAAQLFTPTARKRRLNDLIRTYTQARDAVRTERVGAEGWRAIEGGLQDAEARLTVIAGRRREIAEATNRLKRLRAVAPILAACDGATAGLDAFADLPDMEAPAIAALAGAVQAAATAKERLAVAAAALAQAETELRAIPVDDVVRPWLDAIEALDRQSGAHAEAARDLPRVRGETDRFERDLAAVAVRLGLAEPGDVEARQPSDAARADLKRLLASGRDMEAERVRVRADLDRLRDELDTVRRARPERAPPDDPEPLRLAHEALRPVLARTGQRDALRSEVARMAGELDRAVGRLSPLLRLGDERAVPALPSGETVARHAAALADATRERNKLRDTLDATGAAIADVTHRMRSRQAASAVPDRGALARLRRERDRAWTELRAAAFGQADAPGGADLLHRVAAFERANAAADGLADRLIEDAQRAADQAADAHRLQQLTDDLGPSSARLHDAEHGLEAVQTGWRDLWTPLAIEPLAPAEMIEWRGRAAGLLAQADALAAKRLDARLLSDEVESVRPRLEILADRLGAPGLQGLDVALLDERVSERLRSMAEAWNAGRDGAARIASMEKGVAAGEASLVALTGRQGTWRTRWQDAASACALPGDATLDGASAALDAWADVPGTIRERDDRRRRVAGMKRNMEAHEAELRRIALAVGHPPDAGAAEAARALRQRARSAREAGAARTAQLRSRDDAVRLRDGALGDAERADGAVSTFLARWALPSAGDLPAFVARLGERARLLEKAKALRDELARASEGVAETELRAGLAETHVDAVEGQLSQLASQAEQLDHDGRVAHSDRDRLRAERARVADGIGSEAATARKGAAEIEIRETARRYVVLKLGSLLLAAATERHRSGQQDPLVERAAVLFSDLTGRVYDGLDQTFDERDQPILTGRRRDGLQPVAVANMSEGTRDQLFLALRLAYLEDYADRAEPIPFLGDDIFASFDDRRTEHGLAALAAIGGTVQPILFTHHESVARAAERCLAGQADIVEL